MRDQADKLRSLVKDMKGKDGQKIKEKRNKSRDKKNLAHVYTVTSGKGGVGKSNFTANLALALKEEGKEVIVFDADLGMANLDVILGVNATYNLSHVISGKKSLEDIIIKGPGGVPLVPGGSGVEELANLSKYQVENLIEHWSEIEERFDIILIDTGAGLASSVIDFILAADEVIVISTTEPTSVTDAYGVIKVIANRNKDTKIKLVVNQAIDNKEGTRIGERLVTTARNFLELEIEFLGMLSQDDAVVKAVKRRKPFFLEFPKAKVSRDMTNIVKKLIDKKQEKPKGIKGFFSKMLGFNK